MIEFKYITNEKELLKEIGIPREFIWDYFSLDDWDYALVFEGNIPIAKHPKQLLVGCCSNVWCYITKSNKTVGIAYHA